MDFQPIYPEDAIGQEFFRTVPNYNKSPLEPRSGELRCEVMNSLGDFGGVVRFHSKYGRSPYTRTVIVVDGEIFMETIEDCTIEDYERIVVEHKFWFDTRTQDQIYRSKLWNWAVSAGADEYYGKQAHIAA